MNIRTPSDVAWQAFLRGMKVGAAAFALTLMILQDTFGLERWIAFEKEGWYEWWHPCSLALYIALLLLCIHHTNKARKEANGLDGGL